MECNKEEARRAMDIAERKLSEKDYNGAKKFVDKAQSLYPKLDGLKQFLMMTDVYIYASNGGGESDWYGILGVDPLADDETVKKQYKKLALSLHPDKNRFNGAEDAFKLVLDAWSLLSDKGKRIAYDQKRKHVKQQKSEMKKPPKPQHEPAASSSSSSSSSSSTSASDRAKDAYQAQERVKRWFDESREKVASAIAAAVARGNAYDANCRFKTSGTAYDQKRNLKKDKHKEAERLFKKPAVTTTGNANSTSEAERLFKKPAVTTTGNANSTSEAERLFKKPAVTTTGNANSTSEAERLFKKPAVTTTGNANSTSEAERLFKKPAVTTTGNANSTSEAERLFKKPAVTTTGNANVAERLFKKPAVTTTGNANVAERLFKRPVTTTGNANSTSEAERLFKNPMNT